MQTIHDQLNKLRIISKLTVGNSLSTANNLEIYEFTYYNWIYRKLTNDNKNEVIKFLQEFYKSVDHTCELIVREISFTDNKLDKKRRLIILACSLAEKIHLSIYGLKNLVQTYKKYLNAVSALEGIIEDLAIMTYKQLLETIPGEYQNGILKESIKYNDKILYQGKSAEEINPDDI